HRNAYITDISWKIESTIVKGTKFLYFRFQVRLERYDADYKVKKCDFTWEANYLGWPDSDTPRGCAAGRISTSLRGGWTSDGYLEFDAVGDGKGRIVWQLKGSPQIT